MTTLPKVGDRVRLVDRVPTFAGDLSAGRVFDVSAAWSEAGGGFVNLEENGRGRVCRLAVERVEPAPPVELEDLATFTRPAADPVDQLARMAGLGFEVAAVPYVEREGQAWHTWRRGKARGALGLPSGTVRIFGRKGDRTADSAAAELDAEVAAAAAVEPPLAEAERLVDEAAAIAETPEPPAKATRAAEATVRELVALGAVVKSGPDEISGTFILEHDGGPIVVLANGKALRRGFRELRISDLRPKPEIVTTGRSAARSLFDEG